LIFDAPLQQASLSQNAQWRSQSARDLWRIKPFVEFCNLFVGHNARSGFKKAMTMNTQLTELSEVASEIEDVVDSEKDLSETATGKQNV
jgi:hypothetical protein